MLRRSVLSLVTASAVLALPAAVAAKPGGASPHSPSKPMPLPKHMQKLAAPACGLHEDGSQRVVPARERHTTKVTAKYAAGAIGETITLKATLQLADGAAIGFKPVEFVVDNQVLGVADSDSKGEATYRYKVPNKFGPKTWRARYKGNNLCRASSGSSTVGTVRAPTAITFLPHHYANVGEKTTVTGYLKRTTDNTAVSGRELEAFVGGLRVASAVTSGNGLFTINYVPTAGASPLAIKLQFHGDTLYNPKAAVASMPLYPPKQDVYIRGASLTGYYGQTLNTAAIVTIGVPVTGVKYSGAPVRVWAKLDDNDSAPLGKGTTNQLGLATVPVKLTVKPGVYYMGGYADVPRERYRVDNSGWGGVKLTVLKSPVTLSAVGPGTVNIGATVSYAIKAVRTTDKQGAEDVEVCLGYTCVKTDGAGRATLGFTVTSEGGTGPRTLSFTSKQDDYHLAGVKHLVVQAKPNVH